jgi:hypothetical protein
MEPSPSTKVNVLKNIRLLENRLCADCSLPLSHGGNSSQQMIFGSLTYGVWLCHECSLIHQRLFQDKSQMKSVTDQWNDEEIQAMIRLGSNLQVNESLERYIPSGWVKCSPTSTPAEKELWIRAKYESRLFCLPPNPFAARNNPLSPSGSSDVSTQDQFVKLPLRLLDYFVTVSLGSCLEKEIPTSPLLENIEFSSEIKMCYPGEHFYSDEMTTLPNQLGTFIYPSGLFLSSEEKPPSFFTFVLTDVNAVKMYGGVLHISELVDSEEILHLIQNQPKDDNESTLLPTKSKAHFRHGYRPKALVLLSHYPFYNLFRLLLIQLYRISLSSCPLPLDHYLANIFEIPLPPYGITEVLYHGLPGCPLLLYRPPRNQLPMIDYSFLPLFSSLSIDNILKIFSYLLNEHKLCFCSHNLSILTPIQEAFLSFIFPFVWQGAYIPIIPSSMMIILDAPVPFIVGIDSSCLLNFGTSNYQIPEGLVMINIDQDEVYIGTDFDGKSLEPCELPSREVSKLKEILNRNGGCVYPKQRINPHHRDRDRDRDSTLPFPNNEHLIPLDSYSSSLETGYLIQSTSKLNHYDTTVRSAETKVQVNYQCTISLVPKIDSTLSSFSSPSSPAASASTAAASTAASSSSNQTTRQQSLKLHLKPNEKLVVSGDYLTSSLLSPSNNCARLPPATPGSSNGNSNSQQQQQQQQQQSLGNGTDEIFDLKEIRYAFLRFFVSVLRDYQQFIEENNAANAVAATTRMSNATHGSMKLNKSKSSLSSSHSNPFLTQL